MFGDQIMRVGICAALVLRGVFTALLSSWVVSPTSASVGGTGPDPVVTLEKMRRNIRAGKLPNGFRYVILPVKANEVGLNSGFALVSLGLDYGEADAGPKMELPHLMEHVLVRKFKASDGREINFHELASYWNLPESNRLYADPMLYKFEVPHSRLREGLDFLRSVARNDDLNQADIRSETKIVIAEALMKASSDRQPIFMLGRLFGSPTFAGSSQEARIAALNLTTPDDLLAFHSKWHRANVQTLYIMGEVDPEVVEDEVRRIFSNLPSGAPKPVEPLPPPILHGGRVAYASHIDEAAATLLLGYRSPENSGDQHRSATQKVLLKLVQNKFDRARANDQISLKSLRLAGRQGATGQFSSGIDISFSTRAGEFAGAVAEIFSVLKTIRTSNLGSETLELLKADVQKTVPKFYHERCIKADSILSILIKSNHAGKLGQIDCERSLQKTDIAGVTADDLHAELRRLMDVQTLEFKAVARVGDRGIDRRAVMEAYAKSSPVFFEVDEVSAHTRDLPDLTRSERQVAKASLTSIDSGIFQVEAMTNAKIFLDRNVRGDRFVMRILGPATYQLPRPERGFDGAILAFARRAGFGMLDGPQVRRFSEKYGLEYEVQFLSDYSSIWVSGPDEHVAQGAYLIEQMLLGPNTTKGKLDLYVRSGTRDRCGEVSISAIVDRKLRLGLDFPSTLDEACRSRARLPDAGTIAAIWRRTFGTGWSRLFVIGGRYELLAVQALKALLERNPNEGKSSVVSAKADPYDGDREHKGGHYVLSRGAGLEAEVTVVVPLSLAKTVDRYGVVMGLQAALGGRGRFYDRVRVRESGAYAPVSSVSVYPGQPHTAFLIVSFICHPNDTQRLADAVFDEVAKIQTLGFSSAETRLIDEFLTRQKPNINEGHLAKLIEMVGETDRYRSGARVERSELVAAFENVEKEDMMIFEIRP